MCEGLTEQLLRGCGAQTKIEQGVDISALFCRHIPAGCRAALFLPGDTPPERVRFFSGLLSGFSPRAVLVGEGAETSIFALPDDVRAVVGVGARAIAAARFFTTLRGGLCIAVPDSPSADGCFERAARAPFAGYPLRFPHVVALCEELMCRGEGRALAETALCALCAEELRTDALFSGSAHDVSPLEKLTEAVGARCRGAGILRGELFYLSAAFSLARQNLPPFACMGFDAFLKRRMPQNAPQSALAVLKYCAKRYAFLYGRAVPRAYFVPDYVARIRRAAQKAGMPHGAVFANVRVPTAAESFARVRIFSETRARMAVSARLLGAFVRSVACACCAKERESPVCFPLAEGYDLSAECTPLLCAPALEREFGLSECAESTPRG